MAVRQEIPSFEAALQAPQGGFEAVPRALPAVKIGFRYGADLTEVANTVNMHKRVEVEAAAGAGKSTLLPAHLAAKLGCLVLHVLPSAHLVSHLSDYLASKGRPVHVLGVEGEYPTSGVACTSSAVLVARWLQLGGAELPKCVLFHDEAHEPDAYVDLVRVLGPLQPGVVSYVRATATEGVASYRTMEQSDVRQRSFPADVASAPWDIYDGEMPWGLERLSGHTLIFEDNRQRAEALMSAYGQEGFQVSRLHSRMPLEKFREAMHNLHLSKCECVLIADSSFRSGFTFPVRNVIDSCRVGYPAVVDGKQVYLERPAYPAERYQAAHRAGRVPGSRVYYWGRDEEVPAKVCDLMPADVEVAALLYRLLGYRVPRAVAGAKMASGPVPRDLASALRGKVHLAVYSSDNLIPIEKFYSPGGRDSPYLKTGAPRFSPPAEPTTMPRPAVAEVSPLLSANLSEAIAEAGTESESFAASLASDLQFLLDCEVRGRVSAGDYLMAEGLDSTASTSPAFPRGADSVRTVLDGDDPATIAVGMSRQLRTVAVNALVLDYNIACCELRATASAISQARRSVVGKDPSAVRGWATALAERVTTLTARVGANHSTLETLARDFCGLRVVNCFAEEEGALCSSILASAKALPVKTYTSMEAIRAELRARSLSSSSESSSSGESRTYRNMPIDGRGSRPVIGHMTSFIAAAAGGATAGGVMRRGKALSFSRKR